MNKTIEKTLSLINDEEEEGYRTTLTVEIGRKGIELSLSQLDKESRISHTNLYQLNDNEILEIIKFLNDSINS